MSVWEDPTFPDSDPGVSSFDYDPLGCFTEGIGG